MNFPIFFRLCGLVWCVVASLVVAVRAASESTELRERIAFNQDWWFYKGDPAGTPSGSLGYKTLRPWLLPWANDFLEGVEHVRPEVWPSIEDIHCTLPPAIFDPLGLRESSGWRLLDLPHDWGVEAGFEQGLPGETGKLPWWGSAWYRKEFSLPVAEAGE